MTLPTSVTRSTSTRSSTSFGTVTRRRLERHIRESQEAGRIGRSGETFDKGRFDLVDIRLALRVVALRLPVRIEVRGLPLRHARRGAA